MTKVMTQQRHVVIAENQNQNAFDPPGHLDLRKRPKWNVVSLSILAKLG